MFTMSWALCSMLKFVGKIYILVDVIIVTCALYETLHLQFFPSKCTYLKGGGDIYIYKILTLFPFTCKIFCSLIKDILNSVGGTRWHSRLRHCATSRKVAGLIPDGVIGFFHWHNPSGRTMALGSTQPLTEMSTRSISWGVNAVGA